MNSAEYLAMERAATKHELWRGEVFAMAGASLEHNQIVGNLAWALNNLLGDRPCRVLIVEVLSDSTERFDRGDEFAGYRSLPSVIDYLLVTQTRARIEHYERQADGNWLLRELGPGARLWLRSVEGELAVDDVYHKVALPSAG
jgi:Uma2 family endonuclease